MNLGERIKRARGIKDISLRELADRLDLSASFLSQIEQGKASPSIENLKKIANELGVRVSTLIEDEDISRDTAFTKKDERDIIESKDSKTKISLLTVHAIEKNMEPIFYEIEPGGESGSNFYYHQGEEFVFVLEGELSVYIEDTVYNMYEGDSLYFKSSLKHRFKNNSQKTARAIWVVTPPTF